MSISKVSGDPGPHFVAHHFPEQQVDLGEVLLNFAAAGPADAPPVLLVPAQTESWWGYEPVMKLLEDSFRVYAVDLRGQGRSSRTPGRYTIDNMGNDLVRFLQAVVGRPVVVCGLSSGGVISAWLSAYAPPGLVRAAVCEDPPLFSMELKPAFGHGHHQSRASLMFGAFSRYLGDQWSIGDWPGFVGAMRSAIPQTSTSVPYDEAEPPQMLREYDPEWARATIEGTLSASCSHARMLSRIKTPLLLTHHYRGADPATGLFAGAMSDEQAMQVGTHVKANGQRFEYVSLPDKGHFMHAQDPALYARIVTDWIRKLG